MGVDRQARILEAVLGLLARHGISGVSIEPITSTRTVGELAARRDALLTAIVAATRRPG